MKLKPLPKFILIAAIVGALGYGVTVANQNGWLGTSKLPSSTTVTADVPTGALPNSPSDRSGMPTSGSNVSSYDLGASSMNRPVRLLTIPWNATSALMYANGDAETTPNSLLGQRGVKLLIERQDDYGRMTEEMASFAKDYKGGTANPSNGTPMVIIMGDGVPAFIAATDDVLSKFGQSAEVVGAVGYSRGEDRCMLPPDVRSDPQKARGSLIGAVLRDGDWNICVKWAGDNGIPVNPNEQTYDPDAMNFVATSSFAEADEKYISGYCEERTVTQGGKRTAEKRRVCQNGTATWTPGDVKVAMNRGGLVSVASTKEYMWQMPSTLIVNKQWAERNPDVVSNILAATFDASDRIKGALGRGDDSELLKGSAVLVKVHKEQTPQWWAKYFKGVTERDKQGLMVDLGGSTTNNLADNQFLFGLNGNDSVYKRVYEVYGGISKKLYPDIMPNLVPYAQAVNTAYLQRVAEATKPSAPVTTADMPTFRQDAVVQRTVTQKSWSIEFDTGKASFKPQAIPVLEELLNQISVSGLSVVITGNTDNVGDSSANLQLSRKRAEAVQTWLQMNAPSSFPQGRIRVRAYGDAQPVADNATAEGRAKNRRVDISMVQTGT
ncbi:MULTISPECIES: OmpA family protein [Caballeronia]|jgi:outer membrane protein OmpA-like peptidoglycan-associated protein|uniref:OmpA family protein n=1 Tax=Caballeronia TaxID=1827195 RepID=UPI00025B9783|nr:MULTISPECIES: OmpA family protein [Caballeronia]EKS66750.1 OmpA/MotB domain-containing protein [Burkholderia sp. SJ98]MDR5789972.1 OmpA family protein [Caballeronia sp. LP003]